MTPSQKKKKYKRIQYTCFGGEFVVAMAPFVAVGIANYDKYFVQYDGVKMSLSFFMALAVMGIAIWAIAKKKLENSFATLLVGWAVVAFIFQMMGEMITDLSTIMWFGLAGLAGAFGLDEVSKAYKKKAELINKAQEVADQEELVEAVKEEKKLKVKVKK